MGKEENAGNQHFLLFPQCFLSYPEQILPFRSSLICRLKNAFNLDWFEILSFGKRLTLSVSNKEKNLSFLLATSTLPLENDETV